MWLGFFFVFFLGIECKNWFQSPDQLLWCSLILTCRWGCSEGFFAFPIHYSKATDWYKKRKLLSETHHQRLSVSRNIDHRKPSASGQQIKRYGWTLETRFGFCELLQLNTDRKWLLIRQEEDIPTFVWLHNRLRMLHKWCFILKVRWVMFWQCPQVMLKEL